MLKLPEKLISQLERLAGNRKRVPCSLFPGRAGLKSSGWRGNKIIFGFHSTKFGPLDTQVSYTCISDALRCKARWDLGRQVLNVNYELEGETRRWYLREGSEEAKLAQVELAWASMGAPARLPRSGSPHTWVGQSGYWGD